MRTRSPGDGWLSAWADPTAVSTLAFAGGRLSRNANRKRGVALSGPIPENQPSNGDSSHCAALRKSRSSR